MKILVITARYSLSGVALAQARFAYALARAGHDVTLMIGASDDGFGPTPNDGISVINLKSSRALSMFTPIVRYLRSSRPDIVFSAEDHLNVVVLLAAMATRSTAKISGSSRVTPFDTYSGRLFSKGWILKQLAKATAWRADAQTCVSKDMVLQYRSIFPNGQHQCIYNIVDDQLSRARLNEELDDAWIVADGAPMLIAVGSLQPWKAFDNLIEAAKILRDRAVPFRLAIIGEGPERVPLEHMINQFGLEGQVRLLGQKTNTLPYFRHADVSVLTSKVEGLPNVMVEAMLAGCTPVATDCPTGPRELLDGGRYGYLAEVGNPLSIADAIEHAIRSPIPRALLDEAIAPFEEHRVIARHFDSLGLVDKI